VVEGEAEVVAIVELKEEIMPQLTNYTPQPPRGRPVQSDPNFTLMADTDGEGFIHCGDAVAVVPLTDDGDVLLIKEYSPAFGGEILTLVSGSIQRGESLEWAANRELQE
jgi:hypothetical protein